MKILLAVVTLSVLLITEARPSWPRMHARKENHPNWFSSLVSRNLQHGAQGPTGNCEDLSAAALDVIVAAKGLLQSMHMSDEATINTAMDMYIGFDFVNDDRARDHLYCELTAATSIADLKVRIDGLNDYNARMFRAVYDFMSASALLVHDHDPSNGMIRPLHELGLFSIDPEGTSFIGDNILPYAVPNSVLAGKDFDDVASAYIPPSRDEMSAKCNIIQQIVKGVVGSLPQQMVMQLYMFTGINVMDTERLDTLICDIMQSAPEGIRSVYEVLDDEGIVAHLYQFAFPMYQQAVKAYIPQLEMLVAMSQNAPNNHTPINLYAAALKYLKEVEASGLLSIQ